MRLVKLPDIPYDADDEVVEVAGVLVGGAALHTGVSFPELLRLCPLLLLRPSRCNSFEDCTEVDPTTHIHSLNKKHIIIKSQSGRQKNLGLGTKMVHETLSRF